MGSTWRCMSDDTQAKREEVRDYLHARKKIQAEKLEKGESTVRVIQLYDVGY